jgi:hypothetical protein
VQPVFYWGKQQYLTDFVAMVIGTVRDDRSAQELLTGDFTYYVEESIPNVAFYKPITGDNTDSPHYINLYNLNFNLRQKLVRKAPQRPDFPDAAGVQVFLLIRRPLIQLLVSVDH